MSKKTEKEGVQEWLLEQGYPLEMRVAKICADLNLGLLQGEYFLDPNENKLRETDVIAQFHLSSSNKKVNFHIQFFFECKSLKGKQWLLFAHQRTIIRPPSFLCLTKEAENLMTNIELIQGLPSTGIFSGTFDSGYALTVTHKEKNNDMAYGAMAQVVSATKNWKDLPMGLLGLVSAPTIQIRIPMIVVAESIYKVSLKKGTPFLRKIPCGYLGFKRGTNNKNPDVFILNENCVKKFIQSVIKEVNLLADACDGRPELFNESFVKLKDILFAKAKQRINQ